MEDVGLGMKAAERQGPEGDAPAAIGHLFELDRFASQRLGEEHQAAAPLDVAMDADAPHNERGGILRRDDPGGIGARRGGVDTRRRLLPQRFMRALVVVQDPKAIERARRAQRVRCGGDAVSSLRVRCQRSWRGFCSGSPRAIRSGRIPSMSDQTARRERPAMPRGMANGMPLSLRITVGKPYSRKARSSHRSASAVVWRRTATNCRQYRLWSSASVRGSHRRPSPVRNQPLKSSVQTSLGALTCVSPGDGGARRQRRRARTRPRCCNRAPMVLGAGHAVSGARPCSQARSLRGPQLGCAVRTARIAA